jgi:hypothetical protein
MYPKKFIRCEYAWQASSAKMITSISKTNIGSVRMPGTLGGFGGLTAIGLKR